jgi:hypothetical protein
MYEDKILVRHKYATWDGKHTHAYKKVTKPVNRVIPTGNVMEEWHGPHMEYFVTAMNLLRKMCLTIISERQKVNGKVDKFGQMGWMSQEFLRKGIYDPLEFSYLIENSKQKEFYEDFASLICLMRDSQFVPETIIKIVCPNGLSINDHTLWKEITRITHVGRLAMNLVDPKDSIYIEDIHIMNLYGDDLRHWMQRYAVVHPEYFNTLRQIFQPPKEINELFMKLSIQREDKYDPYSIEVENDEVVIRLSKNKDGTFDIPTIKRILGM